MNNQIAGSQEELIILVKELIEKSVKKLYLNDFNLVKLKMEQSSQARIFYYMQRFIDDLDEYKILKDYVLDCEYNHLYIDRKVTKSRPRGSRPDIILHKREMKDNLFVIEIKMNSLTNNDIEKLKEYTDQSGEYSYLLGVSLILYKQKPNYNYFINGSLLEMEISNGK